MASAALSSSEQSNLQNFLPAIKELLIASTALRSELTIEVVGHSDTTGAEVLNQNLSQRRADRIAWQLTQFGIPGSAIHAKGVATAEPVRPEDSEENRQFNRSATFRVLVTPSNQP